MKIDAHELIQRLQDEWSPPGGFLFELRQGLFDPYAYGRFIALLQSIEDPSSSPLPRRTVSLLWYVPSFVSWQRERVAEAEGDLEAFAKAEVEIRNELERILGVP